ncbi:NUDIX domain-containing protein, partial [Curtobacterium citreum]|uniref:NUDIX domain-containing protein n=1 Tax=Curtobacterium citreum TaxID=2036 RepID=UPI0030B8432F
MRKLVVVSEYRDAAGKRLVDYPRPSVAVDTAVLTLPVEDELSVLQVRDAVDGDWRLPGTFVHEGERLADAVLRSLRAKAGVTGLAPQQLQVFDDPARDSRGWVMSVGHLDVVPFSSLATGLDGSRVRLVPLSGSIAVLTHDDEFTHTCANRDRMQRSCLRRSAQTRGGAHEHHHTRPRDRCRARLRRGRRPRRRLRVQAGGAGTHTHPHGRRRVL